MTYHTVAGTIVTPAGYSTAFASLPTCFWGDFQHVGRLHRAACYTTKGTIIGCLKLS
ncbi:DUF1353 domain-containing protein [Rudanella lutea]|uniref:DUF1353 domain-containing protein n=1 Tax=Rudanella lutea TaxID=451374 RepID=UPI003CCBEBFA